MPLLLGSVAAPVAAQVGAQTTVLDLVETVDLSAPTLSPDGKLVAFRAERPSIARNTTDAEWFVVRSSAGSVRPVGDGGTALTTDAGVVIGGRAVWDPSSRYLYFRALVDGAIGLWRAAADGSGSVRVTNEDADIVSFALNPAGTALVYRIGASRPAIDRAEREDYDDGTLVDRTVDPAQAVFKGALVGGRHLTQRLRGAWFARVGLLDSQPLRDRVLDIATLQTRDATPTDLAGIGPPDTSVVSRSADGDIARVFSVDQESVVEIARASGTSLRRCAAGACGGGRIVAIAWLPHRDALLVTREDADHAQSLQLLDVATAQLRSIMTSTGLVGGDRAGDMPCAVTDDAAFCVSATPESPPRLVRIALADGVSTTIYAPSGEAPAAEGVIVERYDWRDADGHAFTGQLFRPVASSPHPLPLFINYYRCDGYVRGGLGDEWPFVPLAQAGIAGLCINKPSEPPGGQTAIARYGQALAAVRSAIVGLARAKIVDPARVGMGGLSFGSEAAMWIAWHSDLLRAVSIASVQLEPAYYWFNGVAGRDNHANLKATWGIGAPDETLAAWRAVSPALNVDRLHAAILMQLPEQEARLSMELYARLTRSSTPAELYVFPDEPHIKILPRHKLVAYRRNLDWFRFWLQDYVDPDPAKADQYARWRALAATASVSPLPVSPSQERAQVSIETRSNTRK